MRIGFDPFCVTCLVSVSSINSLMPGKETQTARENEQLSFQYFERIVFNGTIERLIRKKSTFSKFKNKLTLPNIGDLKFLCIMKRL